MAIEQHVTEFAEAVYDGDNRSTVDRYKRALKGWLEWLDSESIETWQATTDDLSDHLDGLVQDGYAESYAKVRRAAVSRFYQECAPDGIENISEGIEDTWSTKYKKETELRERDYYVSESEFDGMLDSVPNPNTRNQLILRILRNCGLRRGELAELRTQDIDEREGVIRVFRQKTGQSMGIPVRDGLMLELTRWRDIGRKTMGGYNPDSDWLFPSEKKEKITGTHINKIVKESADGAGIQGVAYTDKAGRDRQKITAHSLRFSSAKALQDKGLSIDKIQTFLGHSNTRQTEHYLRGRDKAMQDAVRATFDE